ncbi:MAG: transposase [Myxococcales bacterium]
MPVGNDDAGEVNAAFVSLLASCKLHDIEPWTSPRPVCDGIRRTLTTNLSRETFSAQEVGLLYRLKWQIELLFKEWKSHANLHKFDTSKAPIAEGMIWASLLAATLKRAITHAAERACGIALSTQRAAPSAKHFLDPILASLLECRRHLLSAIRSAFAFLAANALRAHPERDRKTGRLAAGLRHVIAS